MDLAVASHAGVWHRKHIIIALGDMPEVVSNQREDGMSNSRCKSAMLFSHLPLFVSLHD